MGADHCAYQMLAATYYLVALFEVVSLINSCDFIETVIFKAGSHHDHAGPILFNPKYSFAVVAVENRGGRHRQAAFFSASRMVTSASAPVPAVCSGLKLGILSEKFVTQG